MANTRKTGEDQTQKPSPRFTGFFTGEAPVIVYLPLIFILMINEVLKPPFKLYHKIKEKIDQKKEPKFEDPQLNEWYAYYKLYGKYPEFLLEKYPNLPDLFSGKMNEATFKNLADNSKENSSNDFKASSTA